VDLRGLRQDVRVRGVRFRISIVDGREARMSFMHSRAMGLTWTIFCTCSVGRLKARIWRVSSAARFPAV
jgi:hypothetical protein